jgi:hypothetical protein
MIGNETNKKAQKIQRGRKKAPKDPFEYTTGELFRNARKVRNALLSECSQEDMKYYVQLSFEMIGYLVMAVDQLQAALIATNPTAHKLLNEHGGSPWPVEKRT